MRKFITLPYDVYERLRRYNEENENVDKGLLKNTVFADSLYPKTTIENATSESIDFKLNEILKSKLPDDKKRILYSDLLRKYIDINEPLTEISKSSISTNSSEETHGLNEFNPQSILEDILPKTLIKKGIGFLNYLTLNPDISWDSVGTVSIDNKVITGSNLIDFICHTVRNVSSRPEPTGFKIFRTWLIKQNVPVSFVVNTSILKYLVAPGTSSTDNESFSTPTQDKHRSIDVYTNKNKPSSKIKLEKKKFKWSPY